MTIIQISILSVVGFMAGFVDSIAGGGGLIIIPSFLIAGIPPQWALGTNKFQATLGTSIATINFIHKKKVSVSVILSGILFALGGAYTGSRLILTLDPNIVGKIIIFMLPLGMFATLMPKRVTISHKNLSKLDIFLKIPLICLIIGFYDGFFGPGTGSFLTISFYIFINLNLIEATANAKVFNFVSNLGALVAFIYSGKVLFLLAIPMALANMAGNYLGSHLVLKKGDKIIKLFLILVLITLTVTLIGRYFLS